MQARSIRKSESVELQHPIAAAMNVGPAIVRSDVIAAAKPSRSQRIVCKSAIHQAKVGCDYVRVRAVIWRQVQRCVPSKPQLPPSVSIDGIRMEALVFFAVTEKEELLLEALAEIHGRVRGFNIVLEDGCATHARFPSAPPQ